LNSSWRLSVENLCYTLTRTEKHFQIIPPVQHKSLHQKDLISHEATKITKHGRPAYPIFLCGFVPLCESILFRPEAGLGQSA